MKHKHPRHETRPAYQESEFMESAAARPLRILAEYLDPLTRLRHAGVADTIVMFGSARMSPLEESEAHLRRLDRAHRPRGAEAKHKYVLRLRQAQAAVHMSRYYEEARVLARRITQWSAKFGEKPRRFVICSGGGPGIMEAANRGAAEAGGKSIGLNIQLPHEQFPNPYISPELNFDFHYFFMRKLWFAQLAKALIVFPGGFGTMDELWEMLTLLQSDKIPQRNLILIYGRKYWDEVLDWRAMVRWGTISESDYGLLQFADTVDDAFERVRSELETNHLKVDLDWMG
ncbi:MAG TPA: LOG family protein [Patescibacteria group bacterium]|nr:LOG family protein [Patescibacteria group bacterium]